MKYVIIQNGIISNIIISDSDFANQIGAFPYYDGASIGSKYSPPIKTQPEIQTIEQEITDLMLADMEQGQFATALQLQMMEVTGQHG